jgi:urease accessory protein
VRCRPGLRELEAVIVNTAGGVAAATVTFDVTVEPGARLLVTTAAAERSTARSTGRDHRREARCRAAAALAWCRRRRSYSIERGSRARSTSISPRMRSCCWRRRSCSPLRHGEAVKTRPVRPLAAAPGGRLLHAEAVRLEGAAAAKLERRAVAAGGIAVATVLVVPADEGTAASVRALADRVRGEVGASAWNGFAVVRLCAADGAALRHDLIAVLTALRGAPLSRLWLN